MATRSAVETVRTATLFDGTIKVPTPALVHAGVVQCINPRVVQMNFPPPRTGSRFLTRTQLPETLFKVALVAVRLREALCAALEVHQVVRGHQLMVVTMTLVMVSLGGIRFRGNHGNEEEKEEEEKEEKERRAKGTLHGLEVTDDGGLLRGLNDALTRWLGTCRHAEWVVIDTGTFSTAAKRSIRGHLMTLRFDRSFPGSAASSGRLASKFSARRFCINGR